MVSKIAQSSTKTGCVFQRNCEKKINLNIYETRRKKVQVGKHTRNSKEIIVSSMP